MPSGIIGEAVLVEPLRQAYLERGKRPADVARTLGWMRVRPGRKHMTPDGTRVERMLGVKPYRTGSNEWRLRRHLNYDTAVELADVIGVDLTDLGLQRSYSDKVGGVNDLTERELQILELLAEGLNVQAVARRLHVSRSTVRKHTMSMYEKLDLDSSPDFSRTALAIRLYLEHLHDEHVRAIRAHLKNKYQEEIER